MTQVFVQVFPVIMTFLTGLIIKRFKLLSSKEGDVLLKLVFYIGIPAIVLKSIPKIEISKDLAVLPFSAVAVLLSSGAAALFSGFALKREKTEIVTAVVGATIMNLGVVFPFITAFYGELGLAMALVFDMGNILFVFTITYFIADKFGTKKTSGFSMTGFLKSPPIIAILTALIIKFTGFKIPLVIADFIEFNAKMVFPLIMIALGLKFTPGKKFSWFLVASILSRMGIGFTAGFIILSILNIDLEIKKAVLLCCAAPVGFNTMTFSVLTGLDDDFAASIVSYSVVAGIIGLPLLYFFLETL